MCRRVDYVRMGAADDTSSEGYEPPVGNDFPRGLSEATWWPVVVAGGALLLYAGAGLALVARGSNPVAPGSVGPVVFAAGLAALLAGTFGWLYTAFVEQYWAQDIALFRPDANRLGMVLFIVSDLMTFAAGFVYYAFVRVSPWPPEGLPELMTPILLVNTVVLLLSSGTLELGHRALGRGYRRRFVGYFAATIVLGLVFVAGQVIEYYEFVVAEGFTLTSGIFGSAFYGLTGLHGLHVVFGVLLLATLLVRGAVGQFAPDRDTSVATVSMYWHTVDAIWLVIVTALYLGATFGV